MERVIVLNNDYSFLSTITWKKAICLIVKGKAEVLKKTKKVIYNFEKTVKFYIPLVIKLIKLVRKVYKNKIPYTRKNVYIRDQYTCAYCHTKLSPNECTTDHVKPKAKGGKSSWENCVCACFDCNNKKGDKTCEEARMFVKFTPQAPTINQFTQLSFKSMGLDKILNDLMGY